VNVHCSNPYSNLKYVQVLKKDITISVGRLVNGPSDIINVSVVSWFPNGSMSINVRYVYPQRAATPYIKPGFYVSKKENENKFDALMTV